MNKPVTQASSAILTMHQRYEAALMDFATAEKAEAKCAGAGPQFAFSHAMKTLIQESDALRDAILYQVPRTWPEALVLQFHITNAFDMHANGTTPPTDAEKERLETALDALFDFMCCEVEQNHEALGRAFQDGAGRVFNLRRHRTGEVEP